MNDQNQSDDVCALYAQFYSSALQGLLAAGKVSSGLVHKSADEYAVESIKRYQAFKQHYQQTGEIIKGTKC